MSKIYRASNFPEGNFWMTEIDNAMAYLHNGSLGGDTIYSAQIDLDSLLDLTNSHKFHTYMENILGEDYLGQYPDYTDVVELPKVVAEVKAQGWVGILFEDNYPANAEAVYVFDPLIGTPVENFIDTLREISDSELASIFTLELLKSETFFPEPLKAISTLHRYIANTLGIGEDRVEASLDLLDGNFYLSIEIFNREEHNAFLELDDE